MKLGFIYLPLAALLYNNSAVCSSVNFNEEDEDFEQAVRLSLEESDNNLAIMAHLSLDPTVNQSEVDDDEELELAKQLSLAEHNKNYAFVAKLPLHLTREENKVDEDELLKEALRLSKEFTQSQEFFSREETEEAILLEESYFGNDKKETKIQEKPNNILKDEISHNIIENDILIFGNIFKELNKKFNDDLKNIEDLFFENDKLLYHLDNLFVYDEPEDTLARRAEISVQDLRNLKQRVEARSRDIQTLAKEQGILEPKDQKDKMIAEFMKEKKCSRDVAEKAYKQFIGEN